MNLKIEAGKGLASSPRWSGTPLKTSRKRKEEDEFLKLGRKMRFWVLKKEEKKGSIMV